MNKLVMTLILVTLSVFLYGQEIVVQSTNKDDFALLAMYKSSPEITSAINNLKVVMNANSDYTGKNMSVIVKVIFHDPALNILKLRKTDVYSDLYIWGGNTGGIENRIVLNFIFTEELSGKSKKITFKEFQYQESGNGEQIRELVANYIQEKILKQQNNDVETIIKKGLNAVKNAFDRSFQEKMIGNASSLLPQKKYYKGYTYFGFNWFNFEVTENQDKLPYDLESLYQKDENSNYVRLPDQSVKSLLDEQNAIFTLYNEQYLKVSETEVSTKGESIYYEETNLLVNSDPYKIYPPAKTEIVSNIHIFNGWEYTGNPPNRTIKHSFDNNEKALSQLHKIKVVTGEVSAEKEVGEYTGLSTFGRKFRLNQPTWCNKFARDVTKNTYLNSNAILINEGACAMNKDFNTKTDQYVKLPQDNKGSIWIQYINKGYLVFFSNDEHIEVGFPDNKHYLDMQTRHPDDARYNVLPSNEPTNRIQLTIGAGATVGYKLAAGWATKINDKGRKPDAILYLGYLNFDN